MKYGFLNVAAVAALAAGMAFGQSPTAPKGQREGRPGGPGGPMGRMGADLNLTDAQKQQAQSIFSASRQSAQSIEAQLKESRKALAAAVKAGAADVEIDRLSNTLGPLMAQSTAVHTKAFAKFYGILTPEQKEKLGDGFERMMGGMGGMRSEWRGAQRSDSGQPREWRRAEQ